MRTGARTCRVVKSRLSEKRWLMGKLVLDIDETLRP